MVSDGSPVAGLNGSAVPRTVAEKAAAIREEALTADGSMPDEYWAYLYDFEHAPRATDAAALAQAGIDLVDPEAISGEAIAAKLSEVIDALAQRRVFLIHTDHLSDRQLYERLVQDLLLIEKQDVELSETRAWQLDVLGAGTRDDVRNYLRYYASDEQREAARGSGWLVPPRATPRFVRPLPRFEPPAGAPLVVSAARDRDRDGVYTHISIATWSWHPLAGDA